MLLINSNKSAQASASISWNVHHQVYLVEKFLCLKIKLLIYTVLAISHYSKHSNKLCTKNKQTKKSNNYHAALLCHRDTALFSFLFLSKEQKRICCNGQKNYPIQQYFDTTQTEVSYCINFIFQNVKQQQNQLRRQHVRQVR